MTIRIVPTIRQTLAGRSNPYRLYTIEHCDWEDFAGKATPVVSTRWGVSYSKTYGEDGWTLQVYDVKNIEEGVEHHEIHGQVFDTKEEATHAAFEAGVLAFMVYLSPTEAEAYNNSLEA
jgi:hypothetical protein